MQETGEGVEEEKGEREIKGQGKFVVVSLLAFIRLFAGEKNISRNIYVKFGFSFFFFYSDLPLSNSFSKTHLHFPDLSTANYARRFYPIIRTAQKRVTREIVRINSLMSEGSGFCQTIPDTMPRTRLRLIDFYNTGCRLKSFLDRSGVRLFSVCKKVGVGQACSYARLLCKLGFFSSLLPWLDEIVMYTRVNIHVFIYVCIYREFSSKLDRGRMRQGLQK